MRHLQRKSGHFYFGESGHFYIGPTESRPITWASSTGHRNEP
jgi:hypothetical protein